MSGIIINNNTLQTIKVFEDVTRAKVRDCFDDNEHLTTFVVDKGELPKAIGKGAVTVAKLKKMLNKNLRVIEFNDSIVEFIKNVAKPIVLVNVVELPDGIYVMQVTEHKDRGYLIGRNASILRNNEKIVQKYFSQLKELKIEEVNGAPSATTATKVSVSASAPVESQSESSSDDEELIE